MWRRSIYKEWERLLNLEDEGGNYIFAINLHSIAIAIEFWGKDQELMRFGERTPFH